MPPIPHDGEGARRTGRVSLGLSPYQQLVEDWKACTRCYLHLGRRKVVLARGQIPAEVLFVGEAPGEAEDTLGKPFKGPAGQLLDHIIRRSEPPELCRACGRACVPTVVGKDLQMLCAGCGHPRSPEQVRPVRIAFTNLIACIPRDEDEAGNVKKGTKAGEPPIEAIHACAPRLATFVKMVDPRVIVNVGAYSRDHLDPAAMEIKLHRQIPQVFMVHPAAILRANRAQQGYLEQRNVVALRHAWEDHL